MNKQCIATTKSGTRCRTKPLQGSEFCYFHDPNRKKERLAASAAGGKAGKARTLAPDLPDLTLRTPAELSALVEVTINRLLRGEISHRDANAVAVLVSQQLKILQLQIDTERLDAIEALNNGR